MTEFFSEALSRHDRTGFASGNDRIDLYFRNTVSQDVKRRYAACYVLVESKTEKIAGFYTLSSIGIPLTEIPPDPWSGGLRDFWKLAVFALAAISVTALLNHG